MNQQPDFEVQHHEEEYDAHKLLEPINLSLLHLDNFKNTTHQNRHSCTTCACNPMKRPSPEPKSKTPYSLSDFSKIPLPQLHRTVSEPLSPTKLAKVLEDSSLSKGSASSSLPPKPPALIRSISDPIFSPAKTLSRTSSPQETGMELIIEEESPIAKRLKRMKERVKVMNNWWGETIKDVEDVLSVSNSKNKDDVDCEEAVKVEKIGECLDLQFKCPCGKGYKILLSGNNCYYKLI
ncbi:hypothetical protein F3Y22_tig00016637pilonHSYRG00028 [Hibiscus syriacus]|uniref:Uncharacterized protein n=1 Tax=Hibiscus syriacus TaxID=106335 RepID=A0A6A3BWD0_HIBSY|nr:uncharacterized protein LOC120208566 [Hibiscus syriacus]KAE8721160.1 hypothetical protein F3Y22_tig00016637pilonHSYRG00028 [Hibiscus syriacus]